MNGNVTLMHGPDKVAECKFDKRGYLQSIGKIHNEKLMPIAIRENPTLDLQRWLLGRSLSTGRRDLTRHRDFYGNSNFISEHGISLFDTYWFADEGFNEWEKVNAFDNWICEADSYFLMLLRPDALLDIDRNSPNLEIPGQTPRLWYRDEEGQLYLLFDDAQEQMQKNKANFGYAKRRYVVLHGRMLAMIPAFTSKEVEMLNFEDLYNSCKDDKKSKLENLQATCNQYHLTNWKKFFGLIMEEEERTGIEFELSDIGVLRNTKTLETIGFAPL